jgi:hypothetical protein
MALNIDIKQILLYIYEYFSFLKEELLSNRSRSITGSTQPITKFTNGLRFNQEEEPSDRGSSLVTYQNDYKLLSPQDEPEVCLFLNIYIQFFLRLTLLSFELPNFF